MITKIKIHPNGNC